MSGDMFRRLENQKLDTSRLPRVVGASGSSLGVLGRVTCKININKHSFEQEFLVCEHLKRHLILGIDFARTNRAGVHWTKESTRVLTIDGEKICEATEREQLKGASIFLKQSVKIPPRSIATVEVETNTTCFGKIKMVPDHFSLLTNPNMYMIPLHADMSTRKKGDRIPYSIANLSNEEHLCLSKDFVVGFAECDNSTGEVFEISYDEKEIEIDDNHYRNWLPERRPTSPSGRTSREPSKVDLHKLLSTSTNFIKSPAEVDSHRKVDLQDQNISPETRSKFKDLCKEYDDIVSKGSGDIGKTLLVEMDIDTGDSPPIAQRPYTLPLQHAEWVKKEIDTLERAGIITKSISPWASPVVIVPKKSAPGEPPQRRMCVDFRKLNKLQPEVTNMSGGKGCISLVPLPKIDELYAKLKGYKVFSTLDLRSGYYHIGLSESAKPKTAFVISNLGKYEFNRTPFGLAQAPAYFQKLINMVLYGIDFAMGYLDDIIIFSRTEEEHLKHLEIIFQRLREAGLKLKLQKCSFFKKHIQYLGHLISDEGIQPLPEKLESIRKMSVPTTPKEVKQFLGLVGYYRKFIPRFADISRLLTKLTRKNVSFNWTNECEKCFHLLKEYLQKAPILRYPDPGAEYILYTDASNYAYAGVLTQSIEGTDHPVAYVSGLFRGSQCRWAAMTKEAYAIYMSVKKLSFYLDTARITVRSDHLPLKRFLEKSTLNSKVNNWAVELEDQNISFQYIPGVSNILADTLSRLIQIDNSIKLPQEEPGKEFGYIPFQELPAAQTTVIEECLVTDESDLTDQSGLRIHNDTPIKTDLPITLPVTDETMITLQEKDHSINRLREMWADNKLDKSVYMMERNILKRIIIEDGILYNPVVLPELLRDCVLILAHDKQGHNGARRIYNSIKRLYHWKGMKKHIQIYCTHCKTCAKFNSKANEFEKKHFSSPPQPMEFICMDLIGEFSPVSSKGNRYALTAICMLTGYTFCIPIESKSAKDVANAYLNHIYCTFGPSRKILTDNGTEFKNKLWAEVYKLIRTEHRVTPVYSPQCNGRIEGFHKFLKATIGKQLQGGLEWDSLIWKATAAYNFFPTQSSKHAPFFLMFGREAAVKHMLLASESPKYLGMDEGILNVKLLQNLFHVVGYNLAKARTARDGSITNNRKPPYLKVGTNVLVKDHTAKAFQPKYKDYCVVQLLGAGRVIVKDNHGTLTTFHRKDVKPIDMDMKVAELFQEERNSKTRDANHTMPKARIPNLDWKNYMPPTINKLDQIAVEKGLVENLDCSCTDCEQEQEQEQEEKTPIMEVKEKTLQGHITNKPQKTAPPEAPRFNLVDLIIPSIRKMKEYMYL